MKSFQEFIISEKVMGADFMSWLSKKVFSKDYADALKALDTMLKRKKAEGKERHDIYYYSAQIAKSYANVGSRELADLYQTMIKESEAPTVTTDAVASPDSQPLFKMSKVAGNDCIEVDCETYDKCKFGKKHYGRWENHIQDENLRSFIKTNFSKPKNLMISNKDTGAHVYFKRVD